MQIARNVYQLTGHITGLNANTYALDTEEGLVLIDTGYRPYYVDAMKKMLAFWGLQDKKIAAVFVTHAHFDHSGNAHLFEAEGVSVYASADDAEAMERGGDRCMETVFGTKYTPCKAVRRIKDGERFTFGSACITAIDTPGHTKGHMGFLAEISAIRILFLGDQFIISGASPADEIELEVGYTGSVDYDAAANLRTFEKLCSFDVDIVAVGHRGVYYGDSRELFAKMYEVAKESIAAE